MTVSRQDHAARVSEAVKRPRRSQRAIWISVFTHAPLILISVLFAFPFYWLIVMATSTTYQIFTSPPRFWPSNQFFHNFSVVLNNTEFVRAFGNSLFVTILGSALQVFLAALAGFVFAKYRFPGRNRLFAILLATMVLPTGVSIVPTYQLYADFGWINTFLPLIIPGAVTAFGVFWMRQSATTAIPDELMEAARLDGAGFLRIFWSVGLPGLRPTFAAYALFQIMWNWNEYLWPLLVLNDPNLYTLPVALSALTGAYGAVNYSVVMSGALIVTIPLIILFLFFRRTIMHNVVAGAIKG